MAIKAQCQRNTRAVGMDYSGVLWGCQMRILVYDAAGLTVLGGDLRNMLEDIARERAASMSSATDARHNHHYLIAGLSYTDPVRRIGARSFLLFGSFANEAEAKSFWERIVSWIDNQESVDVFVPRLYGSRGDELRYERRRGVTRVSCLYQEGFPRQRRHAVASLGGESLEKLKEKHGLVPIPPNEEEISRIPHHILMRIVDCVVPRRVV